MSVIKMLRSGTWWVRSNADPRWNASGHSDAVGMFAEPREAAAHIEDQKPLLGDPPADLEWGYVKD